MFAERGGPGNPHARRVARLRGLIVQAVTDDDLGAVVRALVQAAKAGEPWAVRELLDRCIGKVRPASDDAGEPLGAVRFVVTVPGLE